MRKTICTIAIILLVQFSYGQNIILEQALLKRLNNAILTTKERNQYFGAEIYSIYSVLNKDYVGTMIEIENIYKKPHNQFLFFDYLYNKFDADITTDGRVLDRKYFLNNVFYKQLNLSIEDTKTLTKYVDNGDYKKLKGLEENAVNKPVTNTITLPFEINKRLFELTVSESSPYSTIMDTLQINKLLTASLKKRLIAVNKNPELTEDYSFFDIGETKVGSFRTKIFIYQYKGEGLQLYAHLNVLDKTGRIIDTKEVGKYLSTEFDDEAVYASILSNGQIIIKSTKGKTKQVEKYLISSIGKILKS